MPPIGMALGGVDFADLKIVLKAAVRGDPATEVAIRWGSFLNAVITFIIIGFVVWQISKMFIKEDRRRRGQDLPVLQGAERGRRLQVQGLRELDLRSGLTAPPGGQASGLG